jgi:hypothetical protein
LDAGLVFSSTVANVASWESIIPIKTNVVNKFIQKSPSMKSILL